MRNASSTPSASRTEGLRVIAISLRTAALAI